MLWEKQMICTIYNQKSYWFTINPVYLNNPMLTLYATLNQKLVMGVGIYSLHQAWLICAKAAIVVPFIFPFL